MYGNSKLAQMLGVIHFQRLLLASDPSQGYDKVAVHAIHPGTVGSDMAQKDHYNLPKFFTGIANSAIKMFGVCQCFLPALELVEALT